MTQSGALGYSIFNMTQESGIGFSHVVSTGNGMDLDAADFIDFMLDDEQTRMVFAYLEAVRDGAKFVRLADKAFRAGKPLGVLKIGRSETGSRNEREHPYTQGPRLGHREHFPAAKCCAPTRPSVTSLQPETGTVIAEDIPPSGSPDNPVDVTAQAMLADPGAHALVGVITMIVGEPGLCMARDLVRLNQAFARPVMVAWTAGPRLDPLDINPLIVLPQGQGVKVTVPEDPQDGSLPSYRRIIETIIEGVISDKNHALFFFFSNYFG